MIFKMADTNNDGQISQKEAVDAANLAVGVSLGLPLFLYMREARLSRFVIRDS